MGITWLTHTFIFLRHKASYNILMNRVHFSTFIVSKNIPFRFMLGQK